MFFITHSTHWPGGFFIQSQGIQCRKAAASGFSLQTQTSVPQAPASHLRNNEDSCLTKIQFQPWKSGSKKSDQLAYLILFPAWQKSGGKQSMGWFENGTTNSLSTMGVEPAHAAWQQLRAHLPAAGTHTSPRLLICTAALLTLWTCGPDVPQNDIFHSSGAGHFLI